MFIWSSFNYYYTLNSYINLCDECFEFFFAQSFVFQGTQMHM